MTQPEVSHSERRAAAAPVNQRSPQGLLSEPKWKAHATFTVEEAAEILRITRWGAYEAVRTGALPAIRFGRVIRIGRRTIAALLGEQE